MINNKISEYNIKNQNKRIKNADEFINKLLKKKDL